MARLISSRIVLPEDFPKPPTTTIKQQIEEAATEQLSNMRKSRVVCTHTRVLMCAHKCGSVIDLAVGWLGVDKPGRKTCMRPRHQD